MTDVAAIERLSFRAFPAATEVTHNGWKIRSTPVNRSRRVNSATTPLEGPVDLVSDLAEVENFYAARKRDAIVRVLAPSDDAIDAELASHGYEFESETFVMKAGVEPAAADAAVTVEPAPSEEWSACKVAWTAQTPEQAEAWIQGSERVQGDLGCASVRLEGEIVAIGLGVVEDGWVGVFDMNTDPEQRRHGHATRLLTGLMAWAAERSATRSYLQVEEDNGPALGLYAALGYTEAYRYWYRRLRRAEGN